MPDHASVRGYLLEHLAAGCTLIVTPLVMHELVHVLADPRRFEPPIAMAEALAIARSYLDRDNVDWLAVNEDVVRVTFELMDRHALGRRRIADTILAATLMVHGVTDLATCNTRDFQVFDALTVVDPRARP